MRNLTAFLAATLALCALGAASAPAGGLTIRASFELQDRAEPCSPPAPESACRHAESSAFVRGLGRVTLAQTTRVESPGFQLRASGVLTVPGKGDLSFSGDNRRSPGRNRFDFTFTGGTGVFTGATGAGTVVNSLTSTEIATWEASLAVPEYDFDTAPPSLRASAASARLGAKLRVTARYTVSDASRPVALRLVVGRIVSTGRTTASSGSIAVLVRAVPPGVPIRARLTATDAVGNAVTRPLTVAAAAAK